MDKFLIFSLIQVKTQKYYLIGYLDYLHNFTSNLLISMSMMSSFKQFGNKPMECLVPKKFPNSWIQVNKHCTDCRCSLAPTPYTTEKCVVNKSIARVTVTYYETCNDHNRQSSHTHTQMSERRFHFCHNCSNIFTPHA